MKRPLLVLAGTAALLLLAGAGARAGTVPYNSCGPFVSPSPGCGVPTPCQVPGKEYSNYVDKDDSGAADAMQVLMWDGQGGVNDSQFDYGDGIDVDALANCQDALYHAVINDQASLLWSTGTLNSACPTMCMDPRIYYEKPHCCPGNGVWATPDQINASTYDSPDPPGPHLNDVDGLEVWGKEMQDDANRYSLAGDPVWGAGGAVAVFAYDPANMKSTPWLYDAAIMNALNDEFGFGLSEIDLDAMMTWDADCGTGEFDPTTLDPTTGLGDSIMFSLAPVTGTNATLDGGEIFVYDALGIRYLYHGCHLWDTTFNSVTEYGTACENVNALEAVSVPEPVTIAGVMLGVGSLLGYVRRRRK